MEDRVFEALADRQRHRVLQVLNERDPQELPVSVPDGVAGEGGDPERRRVSLYHSHLPKLSSGEYVEWGPDAGTVAPGPNFEELRPLLRFLDGEEVTA